MKDSLSRLIIPTLLAFAILALNNSVLGQTNNTTQTVPCQDRDALGRPTLKRRQPTADDSTRKEDDVTPKSDEKENCKPEGETQTAKDESKIEIRFEALEDIDESDLRKQLREHRVQLPKDPVLEPDIVAKASAAIKEFLVARGYRRVAVNTRVEQTNAESKVLVFIVDQGPRPKIGEYRFEGNRAFPAVQLAEEATQCMARYGRDFYDSDVFDYCLHRLDNFARSQGYLQARFHDPKVEESGGSLIVTLQVDEGVLYRLGEIKIEGASAFSVEEIRAMIPMRSGDIANGGQLSKWLFEDLKEVYGERGYIQYTAEVEPEFNLKPDASEGVVDLKVTIDEGRRFKVFAIDFQGNNLQEKELGQSMLLHKGDIYNQRLFEESIRKLNDTGLFDEIDPDKDADFHTNDEEDLIHIVVKVRKKEAQ